jgi:glycosyltransferase involved in cell wall biosynthesis
MKKMSKILLITDAWHPQVNGVVTTLSNLVEQAKKNGDTVYVYHPRRCTVRFSLWFYPEIEIGIPNPFHIRKLLKKQKWDHIHIATPEGSLGMSFSRTCRRLGIPFSTSCHTKFPEFVNAKWSFIPIDLGWKWMKYLYKDTSTILTTTDSMVQELRDKGFTQNIQSWSRGVDRSLFYPEKRDPNVASNIILLCVSRVSPEKGLDDFCSIVMPNAQKILVGDGPYLETLKRKYPDVLFVGKKKGVELADYYRKATVFVFPSKSDTFGVVNIEALACGTPVAAYPVTGPKDIIEEGINGYLSETLSDAIQKCVYLDRESVYNSSIKWSWENCYKQFSETLLKAR